MGLSRKIGIAFISGDNDAAGIVFAEYRDLLFFIIATYVGNREDCNDLLQETFLEALKSRSKIKKPEAIRSYLSSIARNQARQFLRNQKVEVVEYVDEMYGDGSFDNPLLSVFGCGLSDKETIVVYYRAVFDYEWKEIEKETGIPESTARRIYAKAKKKIKDKI